MRIWDVPTSCLCRSHLLAEHRELHAIWSIILGGKKGYSRHPEVIRWREKLLALHSRHEEQVREMQARGYRHLSPLDPSSVPQAHRGKAQDELLEPVAAQARKLRAKGCGCDPRRRR
jgi:hypothetical protein